MTNRIIECAEALRALAAYLDGELPNGERIDVRHHLETCKSCFSRAEFERQLKARLQELGRSDPTPELLARIRNLAHGSTHPW
jgi:anti-sigma factor (TIGR02949 family)